MRKLCHSTNFRPYFKSNLNKLNLTCLLCYVPLFVRLKWISTWFHQMIIFFSQSHLGKTKKLKINLCFYPWKPQLNILLLCCHPSVGKHAESCSDGGSGLLQSPPKTDFSSAKPHFDLTVGSTWGHKLLSSLPRQPCSSLTELPHNFFPPLYSVWISPTSFDFELPDPTAVCNLPFYHCGLCFQSSRHSPSRNWESETLRQTLREMATVSSLSLLTWRSSAAHQTI